MDWKKNWQKGKTTLDEIEEVFYGWAIGNALRYAKDDMKKDLAERIQSIPDVKRAKAYGNAVKHALIYANDGMKKDLAYKMLDIPDAEEAETYGEAIGNALRYAKDDMKEDLVDVILISRVINLE